jgi:hypothetical protein
VELRRWDGPASKSVIVVAGWGFNLFLGDFPANDDQRRGGVVDRLGQQVLLQAQRAAD